MSTYNPVFEEAIFEEDFSMLEGIGDLIANVKEAGGRVSAEVDDIMIRKMIIRRKFLLKEQDRLKELAKAVKAEWDRKIEKITQDVDGMDELILKYLDETEDKLILDVATVSKRKVPHKLKVVNEDDFLAQLNAEGIVHQFTGEAPVNLTAARTYYLDKLNTEIEQMKTIMNELIKSKEAELKVALKEMKPADRKEAQASFAATKRDMLKGLELSVQDTIEAFRSNLPVSLAYEPESKGLNVRMNY